MTGSAQLFSRYPNQLLVETGTHEGAGINNALAAGFPLVVSIELHDGCYSKCSKMFAPFPQVRVFHGSSTDYLWQVIQLIPAPITFWLDAHYSGGNTAKGDRYSPILQELDIIAKHPVKNHTILIDDRRLMGTVEFDFVTEAEITARLKDINPNYNVFYDIGISELPDDILVAKP